MTELRLVMETPKLTPLHQIEHDVSRAFDHIGATADVSVRVHDVQCRCSLETYDRLLSYCWRHAQVCYYILGELQDTRVETVLEGHGYRSSVVAHFLVNDAGRFVHRLESLPAGSFRQFASVGEMGSDHGLGSRPGVFQLDGYEFELSQLSDDERALISRLRHRISASESMAG